MNKFNWSKALGFGVLIWGVMLVVGLLLAALGATFSIGWVLVLAAAAAVLSYSFATGTDSQTSGQALGYGISWAVIGVVLDLIFTRLFSATSGIFSQWAYWLGYALVLLAPWVEYEIQGAGAHPKTA